MGEPAATFPYPILREVSSMNEQLEEMGGESPTNDISEGSSSIVVTPMPGGIAGEGYSNHSAWSPAAFHALQNPVILTHLFELCPSGLLSKLRLVSREWHRLSLASWRSSFPLTIRYRRDDESCVLNCNEDHSYDKRFKFPLGQFMEHLQNPGNDAATKPFRQLVVEYWLFEKSPWIPQAGWNILGQGVTKLTFDGCEFKGIGELCQLVQELLPSLRSLSLTNCVFRDRWSPENSNWGEPVCGGHLNLKSLSVADSRTAGYIDWPKLLLYWPSLKNLSVDVGKNDIDCVLNVIKTIKRIDKSKLPIRALNLSPRLELSTDPASLEKLVLCQQLNLSLQSIRIRLHPDLEERVIEEIIRFHGGTLKKITALEDPSNPCPSSWKFPLNMKLEKLQELRISVSLLESLEVLKYTPNLIRLYIWHAEYDDYELKPLKSTKTYIVSNTLKHGMEDLELLTLTSFTLDYAVSDDDVRWLIKWMPNMDTLSMVLNDTQFGMVCDGWRHLTELEVLDAELTDVGVTGINPSGPELYQVGVETGGSMGAVKEITSANITLLQDLQRFCCWSSKLTDASVFNGFVKLAKLEELYLYSPCSDPERTVLGEEAKAALLENENLELERMCSCAIYHEF